MNYEQDMEIDSSLLDVECVDHSMLVIKYARIAADADLEMDNAKERLDLVKAELDNKIRTNPDKFKIEKITESVVSNTILMQEDYKTAMAEFLQAKHEAKIVSGATRAVDHRKSMLESLVKLHGQSYFAGPSIPHDLSFEWRKKQEQRNVDSSIAKKLKRNK
jgi:hypothetical protein